MIARYIHLSCREGGLRTFYIRGPVLKGKSDARPTARPTAPSKGGRRAGFIQRHAKNNYPGIKQRLLKTRGPRQETAVKLAVDTEYPQRPPT